MKNRFSWIYRGALAATIVAYATLGDPLLDAWVAVQSLDEPTQFGQISGTESDVDWDSENSSNSIRKSRLVQQQGFGQPGRGQQGGSSLVNQRNQNDTLRAFRESVGDNYKSTVQVLVKNRQVALGAVVANDGWVVTKSSELPNQTAEIKLADGSVADGAVKFRREDVDLALIKIDRTDLRSVQWSTSANIHVGGWLVTTDVQSKPKSIGVVSVTSRNVRREKPVLGVELIATINGEKGALVEKVTPGSGADRAGVQPGDLITTIDGDILKSQFEVTTKLRGLQAGQRVDVGILRSGKKLLITAQMMDLNNALLLDPTEMEVNGEISSRSTGFLNVIQHDSVLSPRQCGGPVVDVYGNVVGINIARAGRVSSYAIPASVASTVVAEMIAAAKSLSTPFEDSVAQSTAPSTNVRASLEVPPSIPSGIDIETLKPEVILPRELRRP